MAAREHFDRAERLARSVGRVRREMLSRVKRAMEREGDDIVQWRLISAIAHDGLHSQVALAERVDIDPAGTSRALDSLEERGFVTRVRDEQDRRRVNVALTVKGKRWYDRARVEVFSELAPLFDELTQREAKQLEELLAKVKSPR